MRDMTKRSSVARGICILGIGGVRRSAAESLRRRRRVQVERRPMRRDLLARLDNELVLLTTRYGDALIGRLRVTRERIDIWQVVERIPCRHRVTLEDIAACCLYFAEEPMWDVPTVPM
jgi:hypothetical protein